MMSICEKTGTVLPEMNEIFNRADETCPVDWALNVAASARLESCGKGTLCRDGINQIWQIIRDITIDKGKNGDLELLKELSDMILLAADCELSGKTALLIQTSLSTHSDEWNAHLTRKRCSALVCAAYYTVHVDPSKCSGCNQCASVCSVKSIAGEQGLIHVVDNELCTRCGACFDICPEHAFLKAGAMKPRCPESPIAVGSFSEGVRRRRRPGGEE
ncbi:MAG: hypothetical protein K0Q48_482 [Bacillota bacterium]|jgi:NADH-quinone oxidoreductase subunit F|nr:hypothetical protein [Bacillota bacterium]